MSPGDPAPIRGRWTLKPHDDDSSRARRLMARNPDDLYGEPVEVVPVPDETAIERGAKATWDYDDGYTPRPWEDAEPDEREEHLERFRAGLRAALEAPEG
jgi:hypothetical protein